MRETERTLDRWVGVLRLHVGKKTSIPFIVGVNGCPKWRTFPPIRLDKSAVLGVILSSRSPGYGIPGRPVSEHHGGPVMGFWGRTEGVNQELLAH